MKTKYTEDFSSAEVKPESPHTGYYCEWGCYHEAYYGAPCNHWTTTGIAPRTMVQLRKEMYPNWADGQYGRPPRGHQTNAMTRTMQRAIIAEAQRRGLVSLEEVLPF